MKMQFSVCRPIALLKKNSNGADRTDDRSLQWATGAAVEQIDETELHNSSPCQCRLDETRVWLLDDCCTTRDQIMINSACLVPIIRMDNIVLQCSRTAVEEKRLPGYPSQKRRRIEKKITAIDQWPPVPNGRIKTTETLLHKYKTTLPVCRPL